MDNLTRSFRFNMILLFGLSTLCSGTITYVIYKFLQFYYHSTNFEDPLTRYRLLIKEIGDVNFFLLIFIPLSLAFFFLFTKRYSYYFQEISRGIRQLANGEFSKPVDIRSGDEFEWIARDIQQAGHKLQQATERGDYAENSKEQLVLNLAHDLRTPLTSVLGYLDYVIRGDGLSEEQIKHYTGIAYAKSRRLEKLIDELFEITRMNYGKLTLDKQWIDISELLVQLNEEIHPALEKNGLVTRLFVTPHVMIRGDGEQLMRVFENLLTNTIRYGKDGKYVDLHCGSDGETATVQVINYGHCIPAEQLPYIFDMFYTGDKARTERKDGNGIGLFIAKNIVEQHGGTITAQSDNIRTVFEVRLPISSEKP